MQPDNSVVAVSRLRDLPGQDRPRERLISAGPALLTMSELVAIVLGTGTRREEVMAMAGRILDEYGGRAVAQETSPRRLAEALDIPLGKACQLIAGFELGRRYYQTAAGRPSVIRTAIQAYACVRAMADLQKEQLRALYLGSRYQLLREEIISVGSLTASIVHPREVFQPAIACGAAAVIVAHNHPSGDPEPTVADLEITDQLAEAGRIMAIPLLDHIVVAATGYRSMIGLEA